MDMQLTNSATPNGHAFGIDQKITTTILALACCCSLSGCASFSDGPIRLYKVRLTEKNLSMLSGTYELYPDSFYQKSSTAGLQAYSSRNRQFHQYVSKNQISFDTLANCHVLVQVSGDQANFLFKENGLNKDSVRLSFRLQSRGMLLLGNKSVTLEGIPYILGGSESQKTRIGLAKDGGLILNHAIDNTGAILFFFMLGYSYNISYHFKRVNSK